MQLVECSTKRFYRNKPVPQTICSRPAWKVCGVGVTSTNETNGTTHEIG